ncbi:hypothetical protein ARMGADRAFT_1087622 [Armillaria gallica]|uniref:DUF6699 domain-containing protein n=1 Tax=Armillaria gallica TaxID=47427 RepID=A0A2H3C7T1_ARMGA|nr:hypothetical protein ARMGADRAFT_1093437 [Armillaria gallica]PBK79109.1 hypothetical protein ARMGADRAFT_1093434 [Armillaria gallica]PBK83194.1 hypothetical protein ARMGADRAFT_1089533 [Armillaria gallica]PBK85172.1 hypothetical protein ARMGADRAFT_1087622 [Armillaria gallica]
MSSSLHAPGKPSHHRIPLPSQIESDNLTVVHPLLQPSRGEVMMELDFTRSLSSVHVLGHEGCVNEVATNPPLPLLAITHPKLPWPVVIQRSGDREWVAVADVVETLARSMHTRPRDVRVGVVVPRKSEGHVLNRSQHVGQSKARGCSPA